MKKIAYIEIDTHAEIAQDFMDLMQESTEFDVSYYFSEKITNQVLGNGKNIHISDSSMILDQLSAEKYDLVIIGTVHRYFNTFLAISEKYNTSIIVHNINFSKISKSDLIINIFKNDQIFRLKLWLKEGLFCTKKAYENAKNYLVLDQELADGRYKFLPLFYTKNFKKISSDVLTIVIPGGVSQKRRDYDKIIKEINDLEIKIKNGLALRTKLIEFVFLGKAKGNMLKKMVDLERSLENVNIQYFSERVSASIFDEWMRKADVLWCPIQEEAEFFSNREIYGKTKMTGNLGDAIKYGKPAVFPKNYSSKLEFIMPEEENLIEQFLKLKNFQYNFQKDFGREKIQKDAEVFLNQLMAI